MLCYTHMGCTVVFRYVLSMVVVTSIMMMMMVSVHPQINVTGKLVCYLCTKVLSIYYLREFTAEIVFVSASNLQSYKYGKDIRTKEVSPHRT